MASYLPALLCHMLVWEARCARDLSRLDANPHCSSALPLPLISCVLTLSNPFLTFVVFILFYFMKIIVYCGPVFSGSLAGVLRLPIRGCRVFDIIGKLSSVNCNLSVTTRLSFKHYLFAVLTGSQEPRSPLFLNCFDRHMTGKYIGRTVELPRELMEMVYSPG